MNLAEKPCPSVWPSVLKHLEATFATEIPGTDARLDLVLSTAAFIAFLYFSNVVIKLFSTKWTPVLSGVALRSIFLQVAHAHKRGILTSASRCEVPWAVTLSKQKNVANMLCPQTVIDAFLSQNTEMSMFGWGERYGHTCAYQHAYARIQDANPKASKHTLQTLNKHQSQRHGTRLPHDCPSKLAVIFLTWTLDSPPDLLPAPSENG